MKGKTKARNKINPNKPTPKISSKQINKITFTHVAKLTMTYLNNINNFGILKSKEKN